MKASWLTPIALAICLLTVGCAGNAYLTDRGRDLADVLTLTVGYGGGAKARVGPIQAAVLYMDTRAGLQGGDILTPDEYNQGIERLTNCVKGVEGADEAIVDKLIALGIISVLDMDEVGVEPLVNELGLESAVAETLVDAAGKQVKAMAAESKQDQPQAATETEEPDQTEDDVPDGEATPTETEQPDKTEDDVPDKEVTPGETEEPDQEEPKTD